jgi:hypothetical protein
MRGWGWRCALSLAVLARTSVQHEGAAIHIIYPRPGDPWARSFYLNLKIEIDQGPDADRLLLRSRCMIKAYGTLMLAFALMCNLYISWRET